MYRLLVVDDEPIIVDALCERFKELKSQQFDVYKAYSGTEALNWLNKKKMDIVITDIKMPGMDGMQLLEKIRMNWPYCKVIFLTGHDKFEYIYKAIQYSGVSYLLKAEGYESIIETVENYIEEIHKSHHDEELLQKAKLQLQKTIPMLQKEFLYELVDGTNTHITQEQLEDVQVPLKADAPVMLLIGYMEEVQEKSAPSRRTDYYKISLIAEEQLSVYATTVSMVYKNYILWLIQLNGSVNLDWASSSDRTAFYLKGVLESVQAVCRETLRLNVSFAIGSTAVQWSGIAEKFISLKDMLNYSKESGMEVVVTDSGFYESESDERFKLNRAGQNVKFMLKRLESLESFMEQGKKAEFFTAFHEIRNSLVQKHDKVSLYYEIFYSLSLLFLSYVNRHGLLELGKGPELEKLTRIDRFVSAEQAVNYFEETAMRIFELQQVEYEKRSAAAIQKVQRYIQENPGGDLSLSSLADLVYFNPKYLSRLFKQVAGTYLSDYITEIKLNKVKGLLRQNDLKVHEIAEFAGYFSAPCFTRFFKREMGMTPQEYRDKHLAHSEP